MIGIIGAMDEEVAMLKEKLTEVQVETKAAIIFTFNTRLTSP